MSGNANGRWHAVGQKRPRQRRRPDGASMSPNREHVTHQAPAAPADTTTTRCHLFFFKCGSAVSCESAFPKNDFASVINKRLLSQGYYGMQITNMYADLLPIQYIFPSSTKTSHPIGNGFRMTFGDVIVALTCAPTYAHHTAQVKCNLTKPHGRPAHTPMQLNTFAKWLKQAQDFLPSSVWEHAPGAPLPYKDKGGSLCVTYRFRSKTTHLVDATLPTSDNLDHRFVGNGIMMFAHITARRPDFTIAPPPIQLEDACRLTDLSKDTDTQDPSNEMTQEETRSSSPATVQEPSDNKTPAFQEQARSSSPVSAHEPSSDMTPASQEEARSSPPSPLHAGDSPDHGNDEIGTPVLQECDFPSLPRAQGDGPEDHDKAENVPTAGLDHNESRNANKRSFAAVTCDSEKPFKRPASGASDTDSPEETATPGPPVMSNLDQHSPLPMDVDVNHHVSNDQPNAY